MDACWGIKFKPMIKKVHTNGSKYYLEILPEVSSLKNFEQIEWKNESSYYEYLIPMTYKVIVSRRGHKTAADESIDSLNPMYHSCVDLLRPSVTNTVLASGDINRIVSDTIIVSKVATTIEKCNIFVSKQTGVSSTCDIQDAITKSMQTFEERDDFTLTKCKNEETCTATKSTILVRQGSQDSIRLAHAQVNPCYERTDYLNNLGEKGTFTSLNVFPSVSVGLSEITILADDLLDDLETIQEILPERSPDEFMHKLSLSPICSVIVNTDYAFITPPRVKRNDSLTSYDTTDRCVIPYQNASSLGENMYNNLSTCLQPISNLHVLEPFTRLTPEKRIEKFMNLLRKEILPLKCMLDNIVMKYAALKVRRSDFIRTDVFYNQPGSLEVLEEKEAEHPKHVKSNRVVYTIVFDG